MDCECMTCRTMKQEQERRERFEMNAVIYFFDNRTYPGISEDVAEALRQRCWADARALYDTGQRLPIKVSVDTKVLQVCTCDFPESCDHPECPGRMLGGHR